MEKTNKSSVYEEGELEICLGGKTRNLHFQRSLQFSSTTHIVLSYTSRQNSPVFDIRFRRILRKLDVYVF